MTIMVIIITIRANHWSFQGENYPSVTCLSPRTASKCPYYRHQRHWVCVSLCLDVCACVCVCLCVTNPLTLMHTLISAPQRTTESVCTHRDNRGEMNAPQGAAAASSTVWRRTLCVHVGPSWPYCSDQLTMCLQSMDWKPYSCHIWDSQSWCVCLIMKECMSMCASVWIQ